MLADNLRKVAQEFVYERAKPFNNNPLANLIRKSLKDDATNAVMYRSDHYKIKGSAGSRHWAAVPWLGFFDPIITESAQDGFYVVFLINAQTSDIYLSLNQGTVAVYREYGEAEGRNVLKRRAEDIRQRLSDQVESYTTFQIDLGSPEPLPMGYEAGHALGFKFSADQIENTQVESALHTILDSYQTLTFRGGLLPTEVMFEEAGSKDIDLCRRFILSRRIERAPQVRRLVLSGRALTCDACGLDPAVDYQYAGKPIDTPLDIHHLTDPRGFSEGERKRYRVPDDFAVLCPTCHRLIHTQSDPSDVEELKSKVRFRHLREMIPGSF